MRCTSLPVLSFLLLLAAARAAQAAESPCEAALSSAQESYDFARFDEIPALLAPCKAAVALRQDKVKAYSLLARASLAQNEEGAARAAIAELLRLDPDFSAAEPPRFVRWVAEERERRKSQSVVSVSGVAENAWEAPGTVAVVTAAEIERRGYLDLESVLHDLPGFDITRGNGDLYSSLYLRGARSSSNDGILLFVDGIEQDNLVSNSIDLSRQYSLAGVERVEVVYGPASSIYGAGASAGVINVITRQPGAGLEAGENLRTDLLAATGSFGTQSVDLELAGRSPFVPDLSWSLGGRFFRSDEENLSRFPDWDYRYDTLDYRALTRLTGDEARRFVAFAPASPLYEARTGENGEPVVELTDRGVEFARAVDRRLVESRALSFSDRTQDFSIDGKLRISGLTLGFQHWLRSEGVSPWYGDRYRVGSEQGGVLVPRQTGLSAEYARSLARARMRLALRYRQNDLSTRVLTVPATFASGDIDLRLLSIRCSPGPDGAISPDCIDARLVSCPASPDGEVVPEFCQRFANRNRPGSAASQLTAEMSLTYDLTEALGAVFGVTVRRNSVPLFANNYLSEQQGVVGSFTFGQLLFKETEGGLFGQVTYRLRTDLRVVAGGRMDANSTENASFPRLSIGPVFHPRLAAVYEPWKTFFLKAVYATGFKMPLNLERLTGQSGDLTEENPGLANPGLRPEEVASFDLSAGWRWPNGAALEATAFETRSRNLIELRPVTVCQGSECAERFVYQNAGDGRVRGVEAQASFHRAPWSLFANCTFSDPVQSDPAGGGDLQVADIARHRLTLGVDADLGRSWTADMRINAVGARRTGAGTTVPSSPLREVGAYQVVQLTLSRRDLLPGITLQVIASNLLGEVYDDPGVRQAGDKFVARIPQPGRAFYLRLVSHLRSRWAG